MTRKMLINANDSRETRVATIQDNRLDGFRISYNERKVAIGNIYLGKVARVEPALQAAFVNYGAERQGFLPFSEIHPDYYSRQGDNHDESEQALPYASVAKTPIPRQKYARNSNDDSYRIQDVIHQGQLVVVQVGKEWPGSHKGASLTTRISLTGRYCVLMPNNQRGGGGISRKIGSHEERTRLQGILDDISLPDGMSLIVRTSGENHSKSQLADDFSALMKLWESIREATHNATPPSFLYEDSKIIMQAIRDIYDDEMDEILVDNENSLEEAKEALRLFSPGHERKVRYYDPNQGALFTHYNIEEGLIALYEPKGDLLSGGYIVVQPTEALTVIDVNSGRATQQRDIEQTALKINMEAADEIARRIILCEIAGLIVIDFIDMESTQNRIRVENRIRELLSQNRARVQIGRITPFGLLEMSRQRLRPSFYALTANICTHCDGRGMVRSQGIMSAHIIRRLESKASIMKEDGYPEHKIILSVHPNIALTLLNDDRHNLHRIENHYDIDIHIIPIHDSKQIPLDFYAFGDENSAEDRDNNERYTPSSSQDHYPNRRKNTHNDRAPYRGKRTSPKGRPPGQRYKYKDSHQRPGTKQLARKASLKDKVLGMFFNR